MMNDSWTDKACEDVDVEPGADTAQGYGVESSEPAFEIQKVSPTKKRGPVKASVYVLFGPVIIVAKVVDGNDGLFVGWPAGTWKRGGKTSYWPWVRFPDEDFKTEVEEAVLVAYDKTVNTKASPSKRSTDH